MGITTGAGTRASGSGGETLRELVIHMPTFAALAAWALVAIVAVRPEILAYGEAEGQRPAASARPDGAEARAFETRVGGYGGVSYTHPSTVTFRNPPGTDLKLEGFDWVGRPFKSPIYYGLRAQRLPVGMGLGGMLDFTHAKAIARDESVATLSGTRDGRDVKSEAKIGDTFRHLEFSHGHNMVTLNGFWRMPALFGGLRPYVGGGAGITLPHTEISFADEKQRTYEYQFAGYVGQALAGVEIPIGRVSVFLEYKFSYAPYSVPLSHEQGWLLVTDVWRQFRNWWDGKKPPGGTLETPLLTQHGISGVMVRLGPAAR